MIEGLTPEEYERRQIENTSAQEEWLDKELKREAEEKQYIYGVPPEEPQEQPQVEYSPIGQAQNTEKGFSWPLIIIGTIAMTAVIALGLVAYKLAEKK